MPVLELVRPGELHRDVLLPDPLRLAQVSDGPLDFGRSRLGALAFLDAARPVPALVLCPLCGEPAAEDCACRNESEGCGTPRVDFEGERTCLPLGVRILVERYGLDGRRPRTLEETARKHGLSRAKVRELEARVIQALRKILGS